MRNKMPNFPDPEWFSLPANRRSWEAQIKTDYIEQAARYVRAGMPIPTAINQAIDDLEMNLIAEGLPAFIASDFRRDYLARRADNLFVLSSFLDHEKNRWLFFGTNSENAVEAAQKPAERIGLARHPK